MWPWALNIKYTHATAVQTSEHCSFPNYSTQATATAQSIVVVVPSRIIPSSYPRITTPLLRPACAALTSYCACPVPSSNATFEQQMMACMHADKLQFIAAGSSSRVQPRFSFPIFSPLPKPIRARDELGWLFYGLVSPWPVDTRARIGYLLQLTTTHGIYSCNLFASVCVYIWTSRQFATKTCR